MTTKASPRVGYVLGTYPSTSEIFVLREILQMEAMGLALEVFAVRPPWDAVVNHPEFQELKAGVIYLAGDRPVLAKAIQLLSAHFKSFFLNPLAYIRTLHFVMWGRRALLIDFRQAGIVADTVHARGITHLHAHFAHEATSVALLASLLTGIPYSFTAYANDIFVRPQFLQDKIRLARFVAAISQFNKRYLTSLCGNDAGCSADNIIVMVSSIPAEYYAPIYQARMQRSDLSVPILLTIARLVRKKGHRHLLDALAILRDRGLALRWIVAGEGPDDVLLRRRVRELDLQDCVEFVGAIDSEQVRQLLLEASVFVLPCVQADDGDMDGMPLVLMEAMSAGVPVVSTRISGIPELITDQVDGLLVEPEDSESLADVIERLLADPEMSANLTIAAHKRIAEQFDVSKNANKLKALFVDTDN